MRLGRQHQTGEVRLRVRTSLVCMPAPRACLPMVSSWLNDADWVLRTALLTDAQWARIEPLLPSSDGMRGRPFRDHRQVLEGIIYRFRVGTPWRDLPSCFGPWQTVWKRHRRFSQDGTWDRLHALLVAEADAAGELVWDVSVDSTINRAHQHGTNMARQAVTADHPGPAGGIDELHEIRS